jgi:hypothetical protein
MRKNLTKYLKNSKRVSLHDFFAFIKTYIIMIILIRKASLPILYTSHSFDWEFLPEGLWFWRSYLCWYSINEPRLGSLCLLGEEYSSIELSLQNNLLVCMHIQVYSNHYFFYMQLAVLPPQYRSNFQPTPT